MSVTLDLPPELEARVEAQAAVQELPVADYIQAMLEQVVLPHPAVPHTVTLEEFDDIMDQLASGSEASSLSPILTREEIYLDHD